MAIYSKVQTLSGPLALGLAGIGLAWMMLPPSRRLSNLVGHTDGGTPFSQQGDGSAAGVAEKTANVAAAARNVFSKAGDRVRESAAMAVEAMPQAGRQAGNELERVNHAERAEAHASTSEPLIAFVAGAGVAAAGALVGTLLLRSKQQDHLLKAASDRLENAASAARQALGNTWEAAGDKVTNVVEALGFPAKAPRPSRRKRARLPRRNLNARPAPSRTSTSRR